MLKTLYITFLFLNLIYSSNLQNNKQNKLISRQINHYYNFYAKNALSKFYIK